MQKLRSLSLRSSLQSFVAVLRCSPSLQSFLQSSLQSSLHSSLQSSLQSFSAVFSAVFTAVFLCNPSLQSFLQSSLQFFSAVFSAAFLCSPFLQSSLQPFSAVLLCSLFCTLLCSLLFNFLLFLAIFVDTQCHRHTPFEQSTLSILAFQLISCILRLICSLDWSKQSSLFNHGRMFLNFYLVHICYQGLVI